ncbi:hypothetical protein KJ682_08670 [bacterium]|nr:hypothetical protein [bacterium]
MYHPLTDPVHRFHIPVMGTGFTIDTPLKVARYGISSAISLVDDKLIEQMRRRLTGDSGREYREITDDDEDPRANRITAYLDMMDEMVEQQVQRIKGGLFAAGTELSRYFEMLPDSPLRAMYESMQSMTDPEQRAKLQESLREKILPGGIDVNIMAKLDRDNFRRGKLLPPQFSDALSALRGYANSRLRSSVVLSAGMNRRLYSYLAEFKDFFPDQAGEIRKRIILKVSDFRSALIQGKLLTRQGLWVSEFRIESGLNCGGHAFDCHGTLLGPVLEDFLHQKDQLVAQLRSAWIEGLKAKGRPAPESLPGIRVTVQGGIGTAEECRLLTEKYGIDGTGWGSPFLLCPEAVNVDEDHLARIIAAGEDDVRLSKASPLGVPFWSLQTSASETERRARLAAGKPGSACPKGYLMANTEFTKVPICTASRAYQRRKLQSLETGNLDEADRLRQTEDVTAKACICHDLAGGATLPLDIDPLAHTAVCCGPNTVYFKHRASLQEMVDHIYGRIQLPVLPTRPHMFLKELSLHLDRLRQASAERRDDMVAAAAKSSGQIRENLLLGIRHYADLGTRLAAEKKDAFLARLEELRADLDKLS